MKLPTRFPIKLGMKLLFIFFSTLAFGENECVVCHKGIEDIRDRESGMMKEILKIADKAGHKGNDCIVCHGGNPYNKSKEYGHKGSVKYFKKNDGPKEFYPKPTDPSVNKNTCGMCHNQQAQNTGIVGSQEYLQYMDHLSKKEPKAFNLKNHQDKNSSHSHDQGCGSCHIPYAKDGLYKGNDVRISKKTPTHLLVHKIQSSRDTHMNVKLDSCIKCHKDKKYTALSYQGLMDIGSSHHVELQEDIHFQKGMLCQDCHTSIDLHGSGYKTNENLAAIEIECQDCHGTTKKYPWELPLGFSDEFNTSVADTKQRGVAKDVAKYLKQGYVAKKEDGYLFSARANALANVVKKDNMVIVHLANGKNIKLKPLKLLKEQKKLSEEALTAMDHVDGHTKNLECYACHTRWSPQYYMDKNKNSFSRWEEPLLARNGEGRISPVIQKKDISLSAHPHTVSKKSRTCESCHVSDKILSKSLVDLKKDYIKPTYLQSNFTLTSELDDKQLSRLDRRGICISCHNTIPKGNLAVSVMTHVAKMSEIDIDKNTHSYILSKLLDIGAWTQVICISLFLLVIIYFIYAKFIKKKPINPRNEGWK